MKTTSETINSILDSNEKNIFEVSAENQDGKTLKVVVNKKTNAVYSSRGYLFNLIFKDNANMYDYQIKEVQKKKNEGLNIKMRSDT